MKEIEISTDKERIDIEMIHEFLSHTYWATGRSKKKVAKSIDNTICFGVYKDDKQIGFARVLTDYVAFAYIMDVFIVEKERGNGYSSELMQRILDYPDTREVQKWFLGTKDAQYLYDKFGFEKVSGDITWMQLRKE